MPEKSLKELGLEYDLAAEAIRHYIVLTQIKKRDAARRGRHNEAHRLGQRIAQLRGEETELKRIAGKLKFYYRTSGRNKPPGYDGTPIRSPDPGGESA